MDNTNEPAAGVWRDARTQEIREPFGTPFLLETDIGDHDDFIVGVWSVDNRGYDPGVFISEKNLITRMSDIVRYARINT